MPSAVRAGNLRPLHPKRAIDMSCNRTRNRVKVRRPSTPRLEFVICCIEGRVAARASVDALRGVVGVVFAGAGTLGTLLAEDAELFWLVRFI